MIDESVFNNLRKTVETWRASGYNKTLTAKKLGTDRKTVLTRLKTAKLQTNLIKDNEDVFGSSRHYVDENKDDFTLDDDIKSVDCHLKELLIKNKGKILFSDATELLDCSPSELINIIEYCRSRGMDVFIVGDYVATGGKDFMSDGEEIEELGIDEIVFGVASDLHFGSICCQITAINKFVHECKKQGVKHILVPGDATAGVNVYKGQIQDIYATGATEQENSLLRNLPTGVEWYVMAGNHDWDFMKSTGHNAILRISKAREDIHYVGSDDVNIPILHGIDAKMWHPSGGLPYSISYRMQKGVEQLAFAELYRIVSNTEKSPTVRFFLVGHLHIQVQAMFGPIFGAQVGCFEGRTNYLKRKGYFPQIGGYIIKASLHKGKILKFEAPFLMFDEIEDDWKNYSHTWDEPLIEKPLFED